MLRIWGRTNSLNVQKALLALEEADVPYERRDAGLSFGVVNTPEYRRMNPNGLVPTIEDGGFVLWESNAIVRYVCAKYAPGRLWSTDPQDRAAAERWMDWQLTTLLDPLNALFRPLVRGMDSPGAEAMEKARETCARNFAILDDLLGRQPYVSGAHFGVGDCSIAPAAHRWFNLPVERPDAPHLEAWYARVRARPSAKVLETPLS
jgi:glutathione S-transferase